MKKSLLLMAMTFAVSFGFAQAPSKTYYNLLVKQSEASQKKAPAAVTKEETTSRRSIATKLYYLAPKGAAFTCWNKEGRGYAASRMSVAPWMEFTFKNMSENPTTNKWHFNYMSSDVYRDLTEYADEDGSYTTELRPGYYLAAPTLVDEQMTDSFTIGYPGAYWDYNSTTYRTAFTTVNVDSISPKSFLNDHGSAGSKGYGWGSLSTGYLYGTGTLDATSSGRGIGVCKAMYQDYPKPMAPFYVEDIFVRLKSVNKKPLAEGKTLKMQVLETYVNEEGKIRETGDVIAELTATADDFEFASEGTSQYSSTGVYASYKVTFAKKEKDDFGMETVVPFVIDKAFRVKIIGLDEEGVDVGIQASMGIDEEFSGLVDEGVFQIYYPDVDATYNHYYTGDAIPFGFTSMFDAVQVADELTNEDETITECNILKVSDDGTSCAVETTAGNLPGVYVYTAQPWTDTESHTEEYYFAQDMPDWITTLNVDESKYQTETERSCLNIVGATCDALPTGTTGRYAILYIQGRGAVSEKPIIVVQGEVDLTGIEAVKTNKVQNVASAIYNVAGQRVDASYKGLVIKDGKKFFVK